MIDREEIAYIVEEIKEEPWKPWSATNREIAEAVFQEIRKENPQAQLHTVAYHHWVNYWITQSKFQRQELLDMLGEIRERRQEELESLQEAIRKLRQEIAEKGEGREDGRQEENLRTAACSAAGDKKPERPDQPLL